MGIYFGFLVTILCVYFIFNFSEYEILISAVTLPYLDVEKSLPKRRVIHLLGEKTACVSAAVSDESVAGDSGVYEAFVKQ